MNLPPSIKILSTILNSHDRKRESTPTTGPDLSHEAWQEHEHTHNVKREETVL